MRLAADPKGMSRLRFYYRWLCSTAPPAEGLAPRTPSLMRENAAELAPRPRLRLTRSEITIHDFGHHRHYDQSKDPAHHTTGSKLAARRAVLKFNLDAHLKIQRAHR
jgi:hypothetical protein